MADPVVLATVIITGGSFAGGLATVLITGGSFIDGSRKDQLLLNGEI